jgi:hypothetical protein
VLCRSKGSICSGEVGIKPPHPTPRRRRWARSGDPCPPERDRGCSRAGTFWPSDDDHECDVTHIVLPPLTLPPVAKRPRQNGPALCPTQGACEPITASCPPCRQFGSARLKVAADSAAPLPRSSMCRTRRTTRRRGPRPTLASRSSTSDASR